MRLLPILALLLALAAGPARADTLIDDAIGHIAATHSDLPAETENLVRETTAEYIARYVKPRDGSFLALPKSSGAWLEITGLRIERITPHHLTAADRANGLQQSAIVSLAADTHRSFDPKTKRWQPWYDRMPVTFPSAIKVDLRDGRWIPSSSTLDHFQAFTARGDARWIPYKPSPVHPVPAVNSRNLLALATSRLGLLVIFALCLPILLPLIGLAFRLALRKPRKPRPPKLVRN